MVGEVLAQSRYSGVRYSSPATGASSRFEVAQGAEPSSIHKAAIGRAGDASRPAARCQISAGRTKALGSACAAARTAWSSRNSSRAPADRATTSSARVLFPSCLAPLTTTTRVSASASAAISLACRGNKPDPISTKRRHRKYDGTWAICRYTHGRSAACVVSVLPKDEWAATLPPMRAIGCIKRNDQRDRVSLRRGVAVQLRPS